MNNWTVVQSKSKKDIDGFPVGDILVRNIIDVQDVIKQRNILDPLITPYEEFLKNE